MIPAEHYSKMQKVYALSEAIARIILKPRRTVEDALNLQQLLLDRKVLISTMGGIRLAGETWNPKPSAPTPMLPQPSGRSSPLPAS
jgi:hypothetical protein